ncbi:MAG: transposase [Actinomycetia bacterium]|nr:transposase [Actinomycetes bacterium]
MAVGHSILVIAWHLLTNDCDDHDLGGDFFIRRDTDRARQRAVAQLQALGYHVKETALDAVRLGFDTVVLGELVRAVDLQPGDGERALAAMRAAGARVEQPA